MKLEKWPEYRIRVNPVIIEESYRLSQDEWRMLQLMTVAFNTNIERERVHRHFHRIDPVVYGSLLDKCEQAGEAVENGRGVRQFVLDDWVPPLDDRL